MHRTIEQMLRACILAGIAPNWPVALVFAEFAINSAASSTTGKAPFELLYGLNIQLPFNLALDIPQNKVTNAPKFIHHVQDTVQQAQEAMSRA